MFTPNFQVGRFLTLGSAAAFAACAFLERGNCFQTGYRNCEVLQSYCGELRSGTLFSLLTLYSVLPFFIVEVHSAFFFSPLIFVFINDCQRAHRLLSLIKLPEEDGGDTVMKGRAPAVQNDP